MNPTSIAEVPHPAGTSSIRSRWARLAAALGARIGDSLLALVARVAAAAIFLQSGRTKVDGLLHVTVEDDASTFELVRQAPGFACAALVAADEVALFGER